MNLDTVFSQGIDDPRFHPDHLFQKVTYTTESILGVNWRDQIKLIEEGCKKNCGKHEENLLLSKSRRSSSSSLEHLQTSSSAANEARILCKVKEARRHEEVGENHPSILVKSPVSTSAAPPVNILSGIQRQIQISDLFASSQDASSEEYVESFGLLNDQQLLLFQNEITNDFFNIYG